ncbi:hypothetical protein [Aestuariivita boseongensis]|nr:hypothetical protein [Aestuariivita boseongensis]
MKRRRPSAILSMQSDNHLAEHWIVVDGTAKVTINVTMRLVSPSQLFEA